MVVVDEMNRRILELLRSDAKLTYGEIARKLKRSPSTVRDRIRRMEEDGIILGYVAVVNAEQMGMRTEALVLGNLGEGILVEDARKLKEVEGVREVLAITGDKRVMIRLQARNNRSLDETISEKVIPFGLTDVEVHLVLDSVMRFPDLSLNSSRQRPS